VAHRRERAVVGHVGHDHAFCAVYRRVDLGDFFLVLAAAVGPGWTVVLMTAAR